MNGAGSFETARETVGLWIKYTERERERQDWSDEVRPALSSVRLQDWKYLDIESNNSPLAGSAV